MYEFIKLILYFMIYSFLGWICESLYCSVLDKKLINRGFLNGPVCPVYGFGSLLVITMLNKYKDNIFAVFILGMILTSVVEYITAVILETSFHTKWWDYSNYKFNIHGRVCLLNSTLFGILSVVLIEVVHSNVAELIQSIPKNINIILAAFFSTIMLADFIVTVITMVKLNNKLKSLIEVLGELKVMNIKLINFEESEIKESIKRFKEQKKPQELIDKLSKQYEKFKSLNVRVLLAKRLIKAFPDLRHKEYQEQFKYLKDIITKKIKK